MTKKRDSKNGLTFKQERFIAEYLIDGNATDAARRAGYSERSAYSAAAKLLEHPRVVAELKKLKKTVLQKVERSVEDIVRDLVTWTQEAHDTGDIRTALKGIELQLKRLGELAEKHEISGPGGSPVQQEMVIRLVRPETRSDGGKG
jgi:phage terminase small subunit